MSNTYQDSNGNRIEKPFIDRRVREAKKELLKNQIDEWGYNFCEEINLDNESGICGASSGVYLDCSHNKSVDRCQKEGCVELAWDIENMEVLCRQHHEIKDKLN